MTGIVKSIVSNIVSNAASDITNVSSSSGPSFTEWALQFDGVNDYLSHSTWGTAGDFLITGVVDINATGNDSWFGSTSADRVLVIAGSLYFYINSVSGGAISVAAAVGTKVPFSFSRSGSTITYNIGAGTVTGSFVLTGALSVDKLGYYGSGNFYRSRMYGQWVFDTLAGNKRTFDFDASNHGAGTVTVTDLEGVGNATGVGMPTDGSAWIGLS